MIADGRIAALDGVRGLAIILVLAFHLAVPFARGGWVGVDVFFVLSGYLITTLILGERRVTGTVSLSRFWARRARRLLPGLLVMVATVVTVSAVTGEVGRTLRGDALAALAYVANWRFIATGESYFATFDVSPLRHTWSLAVEEQFYLVWPIVAVLLLRAVPRARWRIGALVVLAGSSMVWTRIVAGGDAHLSRAYYGFDTRVGTILAGCIAAVAVDAAGEPSRQRLRTLAPGLVATAAAALLAVTAFVPEDRRWLYTHGGFAAVAGAAALLVVGAAHLPPGRVRRATTSPVLVRAGLISYSLYLWHWPVIVLVDADRVDMPRPLIAAVQTGISVGLAELSYRFVEQPILLRRIPLSRPVRTAGAGVAVTALIVAVLGGPSGTTALVPEASSGRVGPPPSASAAATSTAATSTAPTSTAPTSTQATSTAAITAVPPVSAPVEAATSTTEVVTTTTQPVPRDVVVLGDSVVWLVAGHPAPETPFAVRGAFSARCDLIGDRIYTGDDVNDADAGCVHWPERWVAELAHGADAVVVMLGLRQLFDLDVDGRRLVVGSPEWEVEYRAAVRRALGVIRGVVSAPVLWSDVPCYRWEAAGTAGEEHDPARLAVVNGVLRDELSSDPGVTVLDYGGLVCEGTDVDWSRRPDGAHLTIEATHELWRWLQPQIIDAVAAPGP